MHLPNPIISPPWIKRLNTERLILQPLGREDITDIFRLHQYAEVIAFNNLTAPKDIQSTLDLLRPILDQYRHPGQHFAWTIRTPIDGAFRGAIGLNMRPQEPLIGELYYEIEPPFWGHGLATESVHRVLSFAFEELNLRRVKALTATQNIRSIRVLEKVGMKKEGFRRVILPERDIWQDTFEYSIDALL
ncbi:MAG: GNAT family N-acetyltransferase [Bacteroidota bacterium]